MERAPRCPRRQPRQVRQRARVLWALGRFSTGRSARGARGSEFGSFGDVLSKPKPPTWRVCFEVEPRLTAWDGARSALAAKSSTPSPPVRTGSAGGHRFSTGRSARGPRGTGFGTYGHEGSNPQPPTWRGYFAVEPRPKAWGGASSMLAAKTTTPSPPARACSVRGRLVIHGANRARAARHGVRKLLSQKFDAAAENLAQCRRR